jgi:hypothetical protein
MADVVGRAAYELEARTDRLKRDLAGADATVKQQVSGTEAAVAASGGRFSAEMQRNVTRATTAAGAAVGLFVAGSAIEFAKFDDGMRQVFSIMPGISAEAMGSMKRDVLALSKEYGILTDDIVPALATAVGSGIPEENVMDFLRTSAIAAKAGATDTNSAVTAPRASTHSKSPSRMRPPSPTRSSRRSTSALPRSPSSPRRCRASRRKPRRWVCRSTTSSPRSRR